MPDEDQRPTTAAPTRRLEREFDRAMASAGRLRLSGRRGPGLRAASRALELAQRLGHDDLRARSLVMLGEYRLWLGEPESAVATLRRGVEILDRLEDHVGLAAALNVLTMAYVDIGLNEEAVSSATRGLAEAKASGDRNRLAWAYSRLAVPNDEIGNYDAARTALLLGLEIAREIDDPELTFSVLNNLTVNAVYVLRAQAERGDQGVPERVGQARAFADEALAASRRLGKPYPECAVLVNYGVLLANGGAYEQAADRLVSARTVARAHGFRNLETQADEELAELLAARGDDRAAVRAFRTVLRRVERRGDVPTQRRLHGSICQCYKRLRRYRDALRHHELYHELDARLRTQVAESRSRLLAAELELDYARQEMERASVEVALERVRNRELEAEKRALEQRAALLDRRASEDPLTGVWNRRYAEQQLRQLADVAR